MQRPAIVGLVVGLLGGFVLGRVTAEGMSNAGSAVDDNATHRNERPAPAPEATRRRVAKSHVADEMSRAGPAVAQQPSPAVVAKGGQASPGYSDWTKGEFLAYFRLAASGSKDVNVHGLVLAMHTHLGLTHVPLDVVLGMIRSGHLFDSRSLVSAATDAELRTVVRSATSAEVARKDSWSLAHHAAMEIRKRRLDVDAHTIATLLDHEWDIMRGVGIVLAGSAAAFSPRMLELGTDERNDDVRAAAIDALFEGAGTRVPLPPGASGVLRRALENGSSHLRRQIAHFLPKTGAEGGELAAELLAQAWVSG